MNLDNKFGGGFMSIPETNLTNETVVDIKKHIILLLKDNKTLKN